ncbi:hypothetical protein GCM10010533_21310 [Mycolicibacterium pallens]
MVPLAMWLLTGPWRERPGARIFGCAWLVLTLLSVPSLLAFAEPSLWVISRPWYLAWAGLVYVVAAMATLGWIVVTGRRAAGEICSGVELFADSVPQSVAATE